MLIGLAGGGDSVRSNSPDPDQQTAFLQNVSRAETIWRAKSKTQ